MVDNLANTPRSIEDLALASPNEAVKNLGRSVGILKAEAQTRVLRGMRYSVLSLAAVGTYVTGIISYPHYAPRIESFLYDSMNPEYAWILASGIAAFFLARSAGGNFNQAAIARGQITATTAEITAALIAEGTPPILPK